ncbi:MAG: hypothetical protein ACKPHU_28205, partial [Planctomycetaceae bacterium]
FSFQFSVVSFRFSVWRAAGGGGCECWVVWVWAAVFFDRLNSMALRVLCRQLVSREAAKPRRRTKSVQWSGVLWGTVVLRRGFDK